MELILNKRPKNAVIIEGFPGVGFIGSIATEFLIEHLKAEPIGKIRVREQMPIVAVHNSKIIDPFGIFYSKQYNLIILRAIAPVTKMEWEITDAVEKLAQELQAKEIISIEGIASANDDSKVYYYSKKNKEIISIEGIASANDDSKVYYYSKKNSSKFDKLSIEGLKEGVIMGVTASLLLKDKLPSSCIFVETHSKLPDSRGAAKIVETLDKYLGLKVDPNPLVKKAEELETKLKAMMQQGKVTQEEADAKQLDYLG